MSDQVRNLEDRFSHNEAHIVLVESTRENLLNDFVYPSFMFCAKNKKKNKHFFVIVIFKVEKFQGELHG